MAVVCACTDKGAKRSVNQDACCVQAAQTPFGEVVMAVVCDGVGGLSAGELASATVAYRFAQWFEQELPTLLAGMSQSEPLDLNAVQLVWGVLLTSLNETIQAYGRTHSELLGTTFSGLLMCNGAYLVGHVGDCRVYQMGSRGMRQVTEDQTLLAKQLAEGNLSAEEAKSFKQKHVILQSVGTEGMLRPVFYQGTYAPTDLFVLGSDGAYRKAEDKGIHSFFQGIDLANEAALQSACKEMLRYDIRNGEKDNLTVVCVSAALLEGSVPAGGVEGVAGVAGPVGMAANLPMEDGPDDDDLPTMVETDDGPDDEDLPTMVEPSDSGDADDEDLPTMVEPDVSAVADAQSEEDLPTLVEGDEA